MAGVAFLVVVAVGFVARDFLVVVVVVVEGTDAFPTRPEATLLDDDEERGLDVFAFVFEAGVRVDWMVERRRGLEFPVFFGPVEGKRLMCVTNGWLRAWVGIVDRWAMDVPVRARVVAAMMMSREKEERDITTTIKIPFWSFLFFFLLLLLLLLLV